MKPAASTPLPWHVGEDQRGKLRIFSGSYEVLRALSKHGMRSLPPKEIAANRAYAARACTEYPTLVAALRERLRAWDAVGEDEQVPETLNTPHWGDIRKLLAKLGEL